MHTQLVVIGAGPGGYAAAFLAADEGLNVTIVESAPHMGGTCLLRGCIPSKALLHVARVIGEVDELRSDWGVAYEAPSIDIDLIRRRKEKIIRTLTGGLQQLAKRRNVSIIRARGRFQDSQTVLLDGDDDSIPESKSLTFDHAILATGSVPAMPAMFDVASERIMDSTGALELKQIPSSLLVIGGGYIGLEMGSVYASLGSQVSVVEMADGLLPGVDRDLVKPLHQRLSMLFGNRIFLNSKVGSLGDRGNSVEVAFEGPDKFGVEQYENVLIAVGRKPNSHDLGIENTSVELDGNGFVKSDQQQRTTDEKIFAIGDVTGEPMLAHKASHEGKIAIEAILGQPAEFNPLAIPAVVFTDPEIAWAGLTQDQAKLQNRDVAVSIYPWAASGRGHAIGRIEGLTKWLIDPSSNRVIGCGIVGPGAGELIAEAVLAIEMGCDVRDVTSSIHPHPTLSETLMNAGEVHLGTATEIYKPRRG